MERQLLARGDQAVGIVRNPDHAAELLDRGVESAVLDLEAVSLDDVSAILAGADAAVFAAGAGSGSGVERKDTVDRAAATLFAQASVQAGVRRHIQISSMGIDRADDPTVDSAFSLYLKAKAQAEDDLRTKDLDWTILRPGRLTNEPASGLVNLADSVTRGAVTREDVAATVVALLGQPRSIHRTLELINGELPLAEAVSRL